MSVSKKIQMTKNYRLFHKSADNRPTDLKKHKKLIDSMRMYGFLKCFPIVVMRDKDGKLIVKDGQHRLAVAEMLGLTVYWIEEETDFDIAIINCTAKTWHLRDYALKHILNGKKQYQEGLDFSEQHGIPIGMAFALLSGTTTFSNCESQFVDGSFKIKDRPWADAVAGIYSALCSMQPAIKKSTFLEACMAVCRVEAFEPKRLLEGADGTRESLINYGTRDAFLAMLEELYNFRRNSKNRLPLKFLAVSAMRERNGRNSKSGKNGKPHKELVSSEAQD